MTNFIPIIICYLFIFSQCDYKNRKNTIDKKNRIEGKKQYKLLSGVKNDSSFSIKIYTPDYNYNKIYSEDSIAYTSKLYKCLSHKNIDFLLSHQVLPIYVFSTSYKSKVYYNYQENMNLYSAVQYEIIDNPKKKVIVNGFLYCVGQFFEKKVYVSDTTDILGWFTVDIPLRIKPPSTAQPYRKGIYIASLDSKAKKICGEYDIFPKPYHNWFYFEDIKKDFSKVIAEAKM